MATVPTTLTAVVNAKLTAAQWNTYVRDAVGFFINVPRVYAYQGTTTTTLTTAVAATLALDTELYDTDTIHSLVTNTSRLTIVTAGLYEITCSVGFASNATGYRNVIVLKNGAIALARSQQGPSPTANNTAIQCTARENLIVGDYLEIQATQASGGNLATVLGRDYTWLAAEWIAA